MLREEGPRCPYCFELVDSYPDPGGGEHQEYVEDCAVCCRPLRISASYDEELGEYRLSVEGDL